ncbi:hypothetical protein D3C72_1891210 [compost metagenome]
MPMMAMCTSGTDVVSRPLPSFSTSHRVPVSAAAKFTPDRPISASTNAWRRARRPVWIRLSTSSV